MFDSILEKHGELEVVFRKIATSIGPLKKIVKNRIRGNSKSEIAVERNEERIKKSFIKTLNYVNKIANECSLETIACFNNLNEFYKFPYRGFITFFTTTFGSVAYALQKLISVYYASSGAPIETFNIDINKTNGFDGSAIDIFSVYCMDTENLTFYSSGSEVNRNEKIEYISDYEVAQKYLTVCGSRQAFSNLKKLSVLVRQHNLKCLHQLEIRDTEDVLLMEN